MCGVRISSSKGCSDWPLEMRAAPLAAHGHTGELKVATLPPFGVCVIILGGHMGNLVQPTRSASNSLPSVEGFPDAVETEVKRLIKWYDSKNKWKKKCSIFYRG